ARIVSLDEARLHGIDLSAARRNAQASVRLPPRLACHRSRAHFCSSWPPGTLQAGCDTRDRLCGGCNGCVLFHLPFIFSFLARGLVIRSAIYGRGRTVLVYRYRAWVERLNFVVAEDSASAGGIRHSFFADGGFHRSSASGRISLPLDSGDWSVVLARSSVAESWIHVAVIRR